MPIVYTDKDVLTSARERISYIFDRFDSIMVSISGGKDSTVLAHLALQEAHKRNRKIGMFFLDEEAVYQATIDQVEYLMTLYPEHTTRYWLQIPFCLTNSVDLGEGQLYCWDPKQRKNWMRKRSSKNILRPPWSHDPLRMKSAGDGKPYLDFYSVLYNFELTQHNTAHLVGLRADESINRRRAMLKSPGYEDIFWSTRRENGSYTFYPIYDWAFSDVWKYIDTQGLRYHAYYDFAYKKGVPPFKMRVSSLVHEKSFSSIQELPEFEPKTYEKLLVRCKGISFAQETAKAKTMFACKKLPEAYHSWREYRDFLIRTYPDQERVAVFTRRFANQLQNEYVARQQVRQLVLNDYENNLPITNTEDPIVAKVRYWMDVL